MFKSSFYNYFKIIKNILLKKYHKTRMNYLIENESTINKKYSVSDKKNDNIKSEDKIEAFRSQHSNSRDNEKKKKIYFISNMMIIIKKILIL